MCNGQSGGASIYSKGIESKVIFLRLRLNP
jgi:hypothetical protein